MYYAVCTVQCLVCSENCKLFSVKFPVASLSCLVCMVSVQCAIFCVQYSVHYVLDKLLYFVLKCIVQCSVFSVQYAVCIMSQQVEKKGIILLFSSNSIPLITTVL